MATPSSVSSRNALRGATDPLAEEPATRWAAMVDALRDRNICDARVLEAMGALPRHRFVPPYLAESAYTPADLPIGGDQFIPEPFVVAVMTQALQLRGGERVLEIGTGSGYQTALLAMLAETVYSLEIVPELARSARNVLDRLDVWNVHVIEADGSHGWPSAAPYQAILVGAAVMHIEPDLLNQLDEGGRLVVALGDERGQLLERIVKHGATMQTETLTACRLPVFRERGTHRSSLPWVPEG